MATLHNHKIIQYQKSQRYLLNHSCDYLFSKFRLYHPRQPPKCCQVHFLFCSFIIASPAAHGHSIQNPKS